MRRTLMARTGWARSNPAAPTTIKKPRNMARQLVNSASSAIKNEVTCEIAQFVRNTPLALTGKAQAAINSGVNA